MNMGITHLEYDQARFTRFSLFVFIIILIEMQVIILKFTNHFATTLLPPFSFY